MNSSLWRGYGAVMAQRKAATGGLRHKCRSTAHFMAHPPIPKPFYGAALWRSMARRRPKPSTPIPDDAWFGW